MFKLPQIPPALLAKIGRETLTTAALKLERGEALNSFESAMVVMLLRKVADEVENLTTIKKEM